MAEISSEIGADSQESQTECLKNSEQTAPKQADSVTARNFDWVFLGLGVVVIGLSFLLGRESDGVGVSLPLLDYRLPSICAAKNLLGVDCPGCGLTRSFISLAHGNFWASFQANPVGWLYFGVMAFQIPYRSLLIWQWSHDKPTYRIENGPLIFLTVCLIAQWIIKSSYLSYQHFWG
jgi:hypothetical protein